MTSKAVFIISGGMGASARQVLDTVLAQFDTEHVEVIKLPLVRNSSQVRAAVDTAAASAGLIIHTLVDPEQRELLAKLASEKCLATVDLFGDLMEKLTAHLGVPPLAHPGRFRELHRSYCERMDAIDFAIEHDDSQSPRSLLEADIVLIGVSRSGKTPLTMYLAMQGWKVANVSYIPQGTLPEEVFQVPKSRMVGLLISQEQLTSHRERRQSEFGLLGATPYVSQAAVFEELESLRAFLREQRIATIDVTNKPIESTAREVVALVVGRLGDAARRQ